MGEAVTEPEPLLDKLRRLDGVATPGPWRDDGSGFLSQGLPGTVQRAYIGAFSSHDAPLVIALRNALPEIVEAFELLEEAEYAGAWTTEQWRAWKDRVDALLSKVSGGA